MKVRNMFATDLELTDLWVVFANKIFHKIALFHERKQRSILRLRLLNGHLFQKLFFFILETGYRKICCKIR